MFYPDRLSNAAVNEILKLRTKDTDKAIPKKEYLSGSPIIREGDRDRSIYILLHGDVQVQRDAKIVAELGGKGVFIGEIAAFFPRARRSADVVAINRVVALELKPNDLAGLNGMGGELGLAHEIISETARERIVRMNKAERVVSGFPNGEELWSTENTEPELLTPTQFNVLNVQELVGQWKSRRNISTEQAQEAQRIRVINIIRAPGALTRRIAQGK